MYFYVTESGARNPDKITEHEINRYVYCSQNYKYSQLSNCLILQKAAAPLNGHVLSQQQNHGQNLTQNFLDSEQPI